MREIPVKSMLFAISCIASTLAHAHVALEYQVAPASSSYKATFQVGHGCGSAPTRQLVVEIPAVMQGARPMPKPGWRIDVEKSGERVTRVTWTAKTDEDKLASDFYDEFVLVSRTPAHPEPVYWPLVQVCEGARAAWTEVPSPGQKRSDLKFPAPYLEVLPAIISGGQHKH